MLTTILRSQLVWIFIISIVIGADAQNSAPKLPIPQFADRDKADIADSLAYRMREMGEHLCRKAGYGSPEWQTRYNELLTEMALAEHEVIWAAASDLDAEQNARLADFYAESAALLKILDREAAQNSELKAPADKLRAGLDPFAPSLKDIGAGHSIFTVYALRALIAEVDKGSWQTMASIGQTPEYQRRLRRSLNALGEIQFLVYVRGMQNVDQLVPHDSSFAFAVHRLPADLSANFQEAINQSAISRTGIRGVGADALVKFDSEYPWQTLRNVSSPAFDDHTQQLLKGKCVDPTVRVLYQPTRLTDANAARDLLLSHKYKVEMRAMDENAVLRFRGKLFYQKLGTKRGADEMVAMLKNIETLEVAEGKPSRDAADGTDTSPDYSIWITKKASPKPNSITLKFVQQRLNDAQKAAALLRSEGYKVTTEEIRVEDGLTHINQLTYRTRRGATVSEARDIAALVADIEGLRTVAGDLQEAGLRASYDLWLVKEKDNIISWNKNAMNDGVLRGQNRRRFTFVCPANGTTTRIVWGTDVYADDSPFCMAAVHAGVITTARGGTITIEIRPGQNRYDGSTKNGVSTKGYGNWPGSFAVIK